MAEISWIRLRIDMFDDEKIKIIQKIQDFLDLKNLKKE